jgi:hypothetical protein
MGLQLKIQIVVFQHNSTSLTIFDSCPYNICIYYSTMNALDVDIIRTRNVPEIAVCVKK